MSRYPAADLAGQRFGRLLVVERTIAVGGGTLWRCVCDCSGAVRLVGTSDLVMGRRKSCGCARRKGRIAPRHPSIRVERGRKLDALPLADIDDDDRVALAGRPRKRGDCKDGPRPCPWFGCRYHLGLTVSHAGSVRLTWPDDHQPVTTCALDAADNGGMTLDEVAQTANVTRERIRQMETKALRLLQKNNLVSALYK